ncbi:hypothetical protein [Streptantibioticus ferralitis]|uniref:hypothetical protein n=1 Tax=Streptantibioticus ferralitis TaxID=236510 RepID=UPI0023DBDD29|nr:hypothetical protein [Streptantibioticus ferralitis]
MKGVFTAVQRLTDFLTGFTDEFCSVAAYERIDRATLQCRLLLALFALGTNMGIRAIVATGEHGTARTPRSSRTTWTPTAPRWSGSPSPSC